MIPTSGVRQLHYGYLYLNRALGNSTINSYQSYLHLKILLRNMIPTSGVRQLHYVNLCKIAAYSNSTKNCDDNKGH